MGGFQWKGIECYFNAVYLNDGKKKNYNKLEYKINSIYQDVLPVLQPIL